MSGKVYKIIDVVGCSPNSFQEAVQNAVTEASKTLKGLAWFEVKEHRGGIKDGKITEIACWRGWTGRARWSTATNWIRTRFENWPGACSAGRVGWSWRG